MGYCISDLHFSSTLPISTAIKFKLLNFALYVKKSNIAPSGLNNIKVYATLFYNAHASNITNILLYSGNDFKLSETPEGTGPHESEWCDTATITNPIVNPTLYGSQYVVINFTDTAKANAASVINNIVASISSTDSTYTLSFDMFYGETGSFWSPVATVIYGIA